jgi:hypothetical protein
MLNDGPKRGDSADHKSEQWIETNQWKYEEKGHSKDWIKPSLSERNQEIHLFT